MNPFDELSIEEAIRLRERNGPAVQEVVALSAGPAKAQDVLRTAMAMVSYVCRRGTPDDLFNQAHRVQTAVYISKSRRMLMPADSNP